MKKITLYFLMLLLNLASFAVLVGYAGNYELPTFFNEPYGFYATSIVYILSFVLFFIVKVKSPEERFLSDFEVDGSEDESLENEKIILGKTKVPNIHNADAEDNLNKIDEQTANAIKTINKHSDSPETDLKLSINEIVTQTLKDNPVRAQEALIGPIFEKEVPNRIAVQVIDFSEHSNSEENNVEVTNSSVMTNELTVETAESNSKENENSTSNTSSDK